MSDEQGQPSIAVVADDSSAWSDDIVAYLSDRGYQLSRYSEAPDEQRVAQSDAILYGNHLEGSALFGEISDIPSSSRPLLVLIHDYVTAEFPIDWADLVLPPIPHYIDYQLRTVLRLRKENARLRDNIKQLHDDHDRYQRTSDEIEILKNAIVRNVSHELKTPLLQVKSAVALMAEDVNDDELVNYAKGATARLETLVKNITLLGSSLDINPGPVIVRDTVEYAQRNLGRVWEVRNDTQRLSVRVDDGLPPVHADKQGLSTVLQLLMDNALKFSKDTVYVHVRRDDDRIVFEVRDRGIGIASDQVDVIFESFYQIDSSSTRRYGGMGVGLAIVGLILDRHNAKIYVDSKVGEGSTFHFSLPVVEL